MPFIVKWPGVKSWKRNTDFVQNLDYAQTFLEIAGAPQPKDMQGLSLVPLLKGEFQKIGERKYTITIMSILAFT